MTKKPNILLIITDQQNSQMLSCTGNPHVNTPNLDKLASEGTRFSNAVCANPVCIPSRFSLFTGRMPGEIDLRCNADARKIPDVPDAILQKGLGFLFRDAGYDTYYAGKEHLPTFRAKDIGFDYICRDERDELARISANFLKKEHNKPFLLVTSFINPHDVCYMALNAYRRKMSWRKRLDLRFQKWIKKPEFYNVYSLLKSVGYDPEGSGNQGSVDDSKIPVLPKNHNPQKDEPEAIRSLFKRTFRKHARDEWDECEWRLHRYVYAKLTEKVDSQIGQVLSALDNGPHSEDTVVVFTSDHGDHDASHKLEHKTAFYKEAVNIPLIVSGSDTFPKGTVSSQLVSNGLDLLPTLCALAGADPPQGLWGKNIAQIIKDQPAIEREWIPVESEIGRALWNDSWAYVVYDCGEHREQLYDLKNDPGQTRNHIKKNPEILERCRSLIREFWPSLDVPH